MLGRRLLILTLTVIFPLLVDPAYADEDDDILDYLPAILLAAKYKSNPKGVSVLPSYTSRISIERSVGCGLGGRVLGDCFESHRLAIYGEVYNNTPYYITDVSVPFYVFDSNSLIKTGEVSTWLDIIPPFGKTCFIGSAAYSIDVNSTIYEFGLPKYRVTNLRPLKLTPYNLNGFYEDIGGHIHYHVTGLVRNDSNNTAEFVNTATTLYDASGMVLTCGNHYVSHEDGDYSMDPGESGFIDDIFVEYDHNNAVTSYRVQVDSLIK